MELANLIINGAILLFLAALGLILRNYLPSYLNEKGKNLATREDVAEITEKIEGTRSQYLAALEKLKTELAVSSQQQSRIKENENTALIKFFELCLVLVNEKLTVNFGDLTYEERRFPMEYDKSMNQLFTQIFVAYHSLLLYLPDDHSLLQAAYNLTECCLEVRTVFRKYFSDFRKALWFEIDALASGDKAAIEKEVPKTDSASKEYYSHMKPASAKLRLAVGQYIKALNNHFTETGTKLPDLIL